MSVVQQLLESANPYESQLTGAMKLASKWKKSGLLEGLSNDTERANMATLLETQAKQLVVESNTTNQGGATFTAGAGEQYAAVALPLVRKVFGSIAAKEFVSIQPMSLPAGLIFFLDFQYGNSKAPFTAGNSLYGTNSQNNIFSNDAEGGLYGSGRWGYSSNQFAVASASGVFNAAVVSSSLTMADVDYDSNVSASIAAGGIYRISVSTSSLTALDVNGVRAFVVSGSAVNPANLLANYTKLTTTGLINFFYTGSAPTINASTNVLYNKQTKDNNRGDFEDGSTKVPGSGVNAATTIAIPEINVTLASEAIVAKTRKLKAQWTPEFAQDLNAYHSIDAEAELTSLLSEYISMEIDLELIDMLIQDAATTERWSARNNKTWVATGATTGNWSPGTASSTDFYNTQGQWFQTIGTKIQKVSNKIHQKTLRGGANFLVCSPSVATILESIPGYAADTNGDKMDFAMGVQKVGNLNSRFRVYKNPYMTENVILMGYRGSQFLETGAVYAPYIPLIMTPLVYDPVSFTPRKGIMTRYAKKMIRPEFYGKIFVSDLTTV